MRGGKTSDFARNPHFLVVGLNEVLSVKACCPLPLRTSDVNVAGSVDLANLRSALKHISQQSTHLHPDPESQATPRSFAAG